MSEPVKTFPAPSLDVVEPASSSPVPSPWAAQQASKWDREHRAFLALLPELMKTHLGQYVAIHEGRVEDSGPNELELIERVLKRLGNVSIHVGLVAQSEPVERLPRHRNPQRK